MSNKKIKKISKGLPPHMVGNGFKVSNYLPGPDQYNQETSPFILLDYNSPMQVAPTNGKLGVGEHPHRGFETVTIVKDGS
ncbi:MAG: pirin family protein, partial [Flavitalea sp.]